MTSSRVKCSTCAQSLTAQLASFLTPAFIARNAANAGSLFPPGLSSVCHSRGKLSTVCAARDKCYQDLGISVGLGTKQGYPKCNPV